VVQWRFGYDAEGRLTSIEDVDGLVTTITRDGDGKPTAIVAPRGQETTLTLDAEGRLTEIVSPGSITRSFGYDATSGLLTTFTNPRSDVYEFSYEDDGRLATDEDPAGGSKALAKTSDGTSYTVGVTTAEGHETSYRVERAPNGSKTRERALPDGTTQTSVRGRDGHVTTTRPDGTTRSIVLGPDPRFKLAAPFVTQEVTTLPGGPTRTTTRTRSVTLAATPPAEANPFAVDEWREDTTTNGRLTTRLFDFATRTMTTTSPEGRTRTVTLDDKGRAIRIAVPGIEDVVLDYDAEGLLESIAQGTGAGARTTTFTYDAEGHVSTSTDAADRTTTFSYDGAGRVDEAALPGARTIALVNDENGNMTSLTPPGKTAHALDYTAVDRLERYTAPTVDGGVAETEWTYDLDRRVELVAQPGGASIDPAYDAAGRLGSIDLARGTIGFGYDATTGLLTSMTAPGGVSVALSYRGALTESVQWSGPVEGTVSFGYDANFWTTSTAVNGTSTAHGYDDDGLLVSAGSLSLTRDPENGLLTEMSAGVVTTTYTYDTFGALATATTTVSGTPVLAFAYTRDALSRITEIAEDTSSGTTVVEYTYDDAGRLETVTRDGVLSASYGYDDNGNRTSGGGAEVGVYDAQDRLASYGGFTFAHSPSGALQAKTEVATSDVTDFEYDELGNLTAVALPNGDGVDYVVDPKNRRIGKKVNSAWSQKLLYLDQLRVAAELDASNDVVARFVYASKANAPDLVVKASGTFVVVSDHLGSPRLLVDTSSGAVAQSMSFDEFGRVLSDSNPGFQPFGFAGGLYDRDTALVRFGARDYDPTTGRWTAKDPIRFAGGDTNLYAYVANDPVNLMDPNGMDMMPTDSFALPTSMEQVEAIFNSLDMCVDENALLCYSQCVEEVLNYQEMDEMDFALVEAIGGVVGQSTVAQGIINASGTAAATVFQTGAADALAASVAQGATTAAGAVAGGLGIGTVAIEAACIALCAGD
jgi:RHS repeat-associated protein